MNRFLLIIHPDRYFYQSPLSITSRSHVIPILQRLTIPAKSSNLANLDGRRTRKGDTKRFEEIRAQHRDEVVSIPVVDQLHGGTGGDESSISFDAY